MEQQGEHTINASREQVWQALNDPEILAACIPGCQSITRDSDTHFTAKVKAKVGPVSATFEAGLDLENLDPPISYTIAGAVKGGAAGFGKGTADVVLAEAGPDSTQLSYSVKGSVGGKLAQVGSRLVDGAARKMADDFFSAFATQLAPEVAPASESIPEATPESAPQTEATVAGAPGAETHTTEAHTTEAAAASSEQTDQPRYESQGRGFVWVVAFLVLAGAIILAL
ncbi:MAG: carbon monoxide dehydrogenase subunit G [Pseudomonadota bacterium]